MENPKLIAYKKANKQRRQRIIELSGFKNEHDYFVWLLKDKVKKVEIKSINKVKKPTNKTKVVDDNVPVDLVVAFDTTGSMAMYIDAVKTHIIDHINNLFNNTKDLCIKIVAFGDYCDMTNSSEFGIAYQTIELTNDRDALVNFVKNAKNTNGGDSDEFYELVIRKINTETSWRSKSKKMVFFIGDYNPHSVNYNYPLKSYRSSNIKGVKLTQQVFLPYKGEDFIDWRVEANEARNMGIQYDTLRIRNESWYQELSNITGGICLDFKNASKISQVIEASTYARSSKTRFATMYVATMDSMDTELIGVYKSLSTL